MAKLRRPRGLNMAPMKSDHACIVLRRFENQEASLNDHELARVNTKINRMYELACDMQKVLDSSNERRVRGAAG